MKKNRAPLIGHLDSQGTLWQTGQTGHLKRRQHRGQTSMICSPRQGPCLWNRAPFRG